VSIGAINLSDYWTNIFFGEKILEECLFFFLLLWHWMNDESPYTLEYLVKTTSVSV